MRARPWASRSVTLADQVLSSVSNVLAVVLVARVLSAANFGRFALGYAILTLTLTLSRAYFGTRVSLARDSASARRLTGDAVASLVILAPAIAVAVFVISVLATGGKSLIILAIVACATPIVCLQDIIRFGAAASGRPWVAVRSDGIWVLLMAVPFIASIRLSPAAALTLWGAAAVVALAVGLPSLGERPHLHAGLTELRRRDAVGESLTFGSVVVSVGTLVLLFVVTRVIGPTAAGSLRGAATSMGPLNVLMAFTGLGLTPALVRRRRSQDVSFCLATAAVMGALALMWGALLLLLPRWAGTAAFGASWVGIRGVLPWTVTEYTALCIGVGAVLGLKVRKRAGALIRMRLTNGGVAVVAGITAAVLFHAVWTVAAVLAAAAAVAGLVGWGLFARDPDATVTDQVDPEPELRPALVHTREA